MPHLEFMCSLISSHTGQRVAIVKFDARGINGNIRFTEVGGDVLIEANLQGLRGKLATL